jgi:hypothetical protein
MPVKTGVVTAIAPFLFLAVHSQLACPVLDYRKFLVVYSDVYDTVPWLEKDKGIEACSLLVLLLPVPYSY